MLNLTVNVFGILSARFETSFIPPSETSKTEHSCLEIPSPEIQALVRRRRRTDRTTFMGLIVAEYLKNAVNIVGKVLAMPAVTLWIAP